MYSRSASSLRHSISSFSIWLRVRNSFSLARRIGLFATDEVDLLRRASRRRLVLGLGVGLGLLLTLLELALEVARRAGAW